MSEIVDHLRGLASGRADKTDYRLLAFAADRIEWLEAKQNAAAWDLAIIRRLAGAEEGEAASDAVHRMADRLERAEGVAAAASQYVDDWMLDSTTIWPTRDRPVLAPLVEAVEKHRRQPCTTRNAAVQPETPEGT